MKNTVIVCNKEGEAEKPFLTIAIEKHRNKGGVNNRVNLVDIGNRALSDGLDQTKPRKLAIALSSGGGFWVDKHESTARRPTCPYPPSVKQAMAPSLVWILHGILLGEHWLLVPTISTSFLPRRKP